MILHTFFHLNLFLEGKLETGLTITSYNYQPYQIKVEPLQPNKQIKLFPTEKTPHLIKKIYFWRWFSFFAIFLLSFNFL